MSTETITLEVDAEAARAFRSASAEGREKLRVLLVLLLKQYAKSDGESLQETMDDISRKAQARGLTPEILESVLEEG